MTTDAEHYRVRLIEERAAAALARDPAAKKRHSELADLYDEKLKAISKVDELHPRRTLKVAFDNTKQTSTG